MLTLTILTLSLLDSPPPLPVAPAPLLPPKLAEFKASLGAPMIKLSIPSPAILPIGFTITNISITGSTVSLQWQATNQVFQVQGQSDVGMPWKAIGNPTTARTKTFPVGANHYWRVQGSLTMPLTVNTNQPRLTWGVPDLDMSDSLQTFTVKRGTDGTTFPATVGTAPAGGPYQLNDTTPPNQILYYEVLETTAAGVVVPYNVGKLSTAPAPVASLNYNNLSGHVMWTWPNFSLMNALKNLGPVSLKYQIAYLQRSVTNIDTPLSPTGQGTTDLTVITSYPPTDPNWTQIDSFPYPGGYEVATGYGQGPAPSTYPFTTDELSLISAPNHIMHYRLYAILTIGSTTYELDWPVTYGVRGYALAAAVSGGNIALSWDTDTGVDHFYVNRRPNISQPWTTIANNLHSSAYTDTSALASADYQVFGVTSRGEQIPSDIKSINLDGVPSGTLVWAKYFQGVGTEAVAPRSEVHPYSCAIDSAFSVVVGGKFSSKSPYIASLGTGNFSSPGGRFSCFLSKFNSGGTALWTLVFGAPVVSPGSTGEDVIQAVAVDSQDNIIVGGYLEDSTDVSGGRNPALGTITFTGSGNIRRMFLAKYTSAGDLMWALQFVGNFHDRLMALSVDGSNNILLTGIQESTSLALNNGKTTSWVYGGTSINTTTLIAKFAPGSQGVAGLCQWARAVGGNSQGTSPFGCNLDSAGNLVVAGIAGGTAVDVGGGPVNVSDPSVLAPYVMKFSNFDGSAMWTGSPHIYVPQGSTFNSFIVYGVSVSPVNGNVFVAGSGEGTVNFGGGNITSGSGGAANSHVWIGYDQGGNWLWNDVWGGDVAGGIIDSTKCTAIAADGVHVDFGGIFNSSMQPLNGTSQETPGNGYYVATMITNGNQKPFFIWAQRNLAANGNGITPSIAIRGTVLITCGEWNGAAFDPGGIIDPVSPQSVAGFLCRYRL